MVDLCDFVADDGSVSNIQLLEATEAANNGELSNEDVLILTQAANNNETVDQCVDGGGTANTSSLSVSLPTATKQAQGVYTVSATVSNNVTSGDGESLTATATLTVDGSTESTTSVTPPVGGSETVQFTLSGLSPGSYNVCVEVVG